MAANLEFLGLFVPDLQQAEAYYRDLFEMEVITRETPQSDGNWYALPPDKDWSDVEQAGIKLLMLALRRDDFVLALFQGKPAVGQIFAVGLSMGAEELETIKGRVPGNDVVQYEAGQMLHFRDMYKCVWQIYSTPYRFRGTGETTGRWLDLD
jgi:catechol 2,3-dioxygenase-like lactoylglutathione lyase family enzyme